VETGHPYIAGLLGEVGHFSWRFDTKLFNFRYTYLDISFLKKMGLTRDLIGLNKEVYREYPKV
jgi:hypothetical protein